MHGGRQAKLVNVRHFSDNGSTNKPPTIQRVIAIGTKACAVHRNGKIDVFFLVKYVIQLLPQFMAKHAVEHVMGYRAILHDLNLAIDANGQWAAGAHMKVRYAILFR